MPRLLILLLLLGCDDADKSGTTDDVPRDDTADRTDEDGDGHFLEGGEDGEPADCDDGDAATHPGAADPCGDGIDQDCDGAAPACPCPDGDGDGYVLDDGSGCDAGEDALDCDDADPTTNPGELESCNGKDDDCDALIDEVWTGADSADTGDTGDAGGEEAPDPGLGYEIYGRDADGDGFGDPGDTMYACEGAVPEGYLADITDCDDADADDRPGAEEICDEENDDDDCDDLADDDDPDLEGSTADYEALYSDGDSDGYGAADGFTLRTDLCDPPDDKWSRTGDDCDDADALIHPDAVELCDADDDDEDCDGYVDDGDDSVDTSTYSSWYEDADGDTFTTTTSTSTCDPPTGYTTASTAEDCDDTDAEVNPAELERCDGKDEDCDGAIDEDDSLDASTWYADADGDEFGDPLVTSTSCYGGDGWVLDATDCDDTDPTISPEGIETCDDADEDCDGETDEEARGAPTWYRDADGDTYGWIYTHTDDCERPEGYVADDTDCDDGDSDYHDKTIYYRDSDVDGFGDPASTTFTCGDAKTGYVGNALDCNDTLTKVNPGAGEICDDIDNDCDGAIDDEDWDVLSTSLSVWYPDTDADGYGNGDDESSYLYTCDAPIGSVGNGLDCDDGDDDVNPSADEACDGEDSNCNGTIDEDCGMQIQSQTIYLDSTGATSYPSSASVTFAIPTGATDVLAFLAPQQNIEHDDDNCDYVTEITEEADSVTFEIAITGGCGRDYASPPVVAQAVVMSRYGDEGWFRSFDMSWSDTRSGDLALPDSVGSEVAFCSVLSFDDDGDDSDTAWTCAVDADWDSRIMSGALDQDYGAGIVLDTRAVAIGLTDNLEMTLEAYQCDPSGGGSATLSHSLGAGSDHDAFILPYNIDSDENNHFSYWTVCTEGATTYDCTINCRGSVDHQRGYVLFVDGDYE